MIHSPSFKTVYLAVVIGLTGIFYAGCSPDRDQKFERLSSSKTGIDFTNTVESSPEFNIINYMYFYDGAGVAAGDLNNNGLPDLFFVGNEVPNKLYENHGNFEFEDISEAAGIRGDNGSWSTGVTMADVNGNGYLDIYISRVNFLNKSGRNQLFINNGDMTFTERAAEFGIDFEGYSTQAAFFDYNKDGLLDLFILNHSFHSERTYGRADILREMQDGKAGDKLFRNDGGTYTDVSEEAGIYSSALGYGLGLAVSDIDKNGWPDLYIGNDFHEDDYLYINNGNGTFTESLYQSVGHTSNSSMGNDIADINNDGYMDIVSLDMMPADHESFMRSGGPDLMNVYTAKKHAGFGEKNGRNTVQIHRGLSPDGMPVFSEMGFTLGVAQTDWSWAPLLADFNNSGYKDLFVTNGMIHRPNDLDYQRIIGNIRDRSTEGAVTDEEFETIEQMPAIHEPDYMFQNNGDLSFTNVTSDWGLDHPTYSSGAVYVDLNNNGMLDLVVNKVNEQASVYRNNSVADSAANYLKIKLNGNQENSTGIGSKLIAFKEGEQFYHEQFPTRGFQSSVPHQIHAGLGNRTSVDSVLVIWPDDRFETKNNIQANQLLEFNREDASGEYPYENLHRSYENTYFENVTKQFGFNFSHRENSYDDFSQEPLLPYKLSTEGPALAVGDVTRNGLDDMFLGGAHHQASAFYEQVSEGEFRKRYEDHFETHSSSEDVDALFFDATGNGALDLYVVTGGSQLLAQDEQLGDRLYINDGRGELQPASERLPDHLMNGSVVRAADINDDGALDLFVGGRSVPWLYGKSPAHQILMNSGDGHFEDVTEQIIPGLRETGMITDAAWADVTGNGYTDLILAGEWMPIMLFENRGDHFADVSQEFGLENTSGLWQSIAVGDITNNGEMDVIAGNFGTNTRMQPSPENPYRLYINDFDDSGYTSGIVTRPHDQKMVPFEQLDELIQELPAITGGIRSYRDFASKSVEDLFGREAIAEAETRNLEELRSFAFLNDGNRNLKKEVLPVEIQAYPVKAIEVIHPESSEEPIILLGGNHYEVKPGYGGRQDAGYGSMLRYNIENGFSPATLQESGFYVNGQIRDLKTVHINGDDFYIVAAINDQNPAIFRMNKKP